MKSNDEKKIKILIAEDDKIANMRYDRSISDITFLKKFVTNGEDVIETYQSWNPDIILLDIMLPNASGYSLLEKIRKEFNDHHTVIIMATSLSHELDIKNCMELGIQGYFVKPINMKEVGFKIFNIWKKQKCNRDHS